MRTLKANLAANAYGKGLPFGIAGRFQHLKWKRPEQSRVSVGRLRTSRSSSSPPRPTTSSKESRTKASRTNGRTAGPGASSIQRRKTQTNFTVNGSTTGTASDMCVGPLKINFGLFMRLSAPPTPAPLTASAQNGQSLFTRHRVCRLRNSPNLDDRFASPFTGMSNFTYHPYSDFALHHMGGQLADGISQGAAVADEFRTAPLWGLGQRLFFMHDGRTPRISVQADTGSRLNAGGGLDTVTVQNYEQFNAAGFWFQPFVQVQTTTSEAQTVVNNFKALTVSQQSDLLNFLRSL